MGLRYQQQLPSGDLSSLPDALRAVVSASEDNFVSKDRGSVRAANDGTFDSRANHFVHWLQRYGTDLRLLPSYPPGVAIKIIGAYVEQVNLGDSYKGLQNLADKTLNGYIQAAAAAWQHYAGYAVPIYQPSVPGKENKLVPFLSDILAQRRAWKKPKQKKEPVTYAMYEALDRRCSYYARQDGSYFLSVEYAVYDWMRLCLLTGSRLGEYGQSKPSKKNPIARVPMDTNAGEWAGKPIAFIFEDFNYYDRDLIHRSHADCMSMPTLPAYLHLRIRFDKSAENFLIRKFARLKNFLCPLQSSISILKRATMLGISNDIPVGAYRRVGDTAGQYTFINGTDVKRVMQLACVLAYPDPKHYLRERIDLLMAHSLRVTAAVALYNAGEDIPTIAFKLRWSEQSVSTYLRDCFKAIGPVTEAAVRGAFLT